jgi:sugar/nucleoside kinase (ribokinase family)
MIVVVGHPVVSSAEPGIDGTAVRTALAAARAGARVELVGKAGEDAEGDAVLLALARAGVGHAALLRDPTHRTPVMVPATETDEDVLQPTDEDDDTGAPSAPALLPADPADRPTLEPADVELALHYLPDIRVVVVAGPVAPGVVAAAGEWASYANAHLVVLAEREAEEISEAAELPPGSLVLEAPAWDPDDALAAIVGEYAAEVDGGASPEAAFGRLRDRLSSGAAAG